MNGEWVILKDDSIIAKDKELKVILELAEDYDEEEITISKEPSAELCFY